MADFNTQILPPIIDNTISAFVFDTETTSNKGLEVVFYHQSKVNEEGGVQSDYVLIELKAGADSLLKGDIQVAQARIVNRFDNDNPDEVKYYCIIPPSALKNEEFDISRQMVVRIASIKYDSALAKSVRPDNYDLSALLEANKGDYSQWSEGAIKYALPPFNFTLKGGGILEDGDDGTVLTEAVQDYSNTNDNGYIIKGEIDLENSVDSIAWFRAVFTDTSTLFSNKTLDSTEGERYPEDPKDPTNRNFFSYTFTNLHSAIEVEKTSSMKLTVVFKTLKGYIGTYIYNFNIPEASDDNKPSVPQSQVADYLEFQSFEDESTLQVIPNPTHGSFILKHKLGLIENEEHKEGELIVGTYIYQKAKKASKLAWATFYEESAIITTTAEPIEHSFEDITAEAGIPYCYRVLFKFISANQTWYAKNTAANTSSNILFFDGSFLATKDLAMRVLYNNTVSNFKRNIQTIVTPTLGGKYPFIRRGGQQDYHTFSLSGLISFNSEQYLDDLVTMPYTAQSVMPLSSDARPEVIGGVDPFANSLLINKHGIRDISLSDLESLDPTDRDHVIERLFRQKVMDFLHADQVVLFKSFTEGNMFVRLTDISFTPNEQLSRNIWTFQATATEVLEANCFNYLEAFGEKKETDKFVLTDTYLHTMRIDEKTDDFPEGEVAYVSQAYFTSTTSTESIFDENLIDTVAKQEVPSYGETSYTKTVQLKIYNPPLNNSTAKRNGEENGKSYWIVEKTVPVSNFMPEVESVTYKDKNEDAITTEETTVYSGILVQDETTFI